MVMLVSGERPATMLGKRAAPRRKTKARIVQLLLTNA